MDYEEEYFTKTAYPNGYFDHIINTKRVSNILKLAKPKRVLDVGCAYGYIVKRLLDKGIYAEGVDVSKWCQEKAKAIIPGHFKLAPAHKLPYPGKHFDTIYCEGVLEHVDEMFIQEVREEFERVAECFILAVTFKMPATLGHICNHDKEWWGHWMPVNSYLYLTNNSTDTGGDWGYKGPKGLYKVITGEELEQIQEPIRKP